MDKKELKTKIDELLTRGVEKIYPSKEALREILMSDKKLKIYNGIDPTGKLHIGHAVVLRKLRQFQDLGHEIIVLIGDFTARIGDPTDKSATRKQLTKEEVEKNAEDYKKLIGKILDTSKSNLRFLHNEKWTNQLKPVNLLELLSNFTYQQFIERDMFQERIKNNKEIYLHEFLYPAFQAYDAVTMDVDLQIGGNDQIFNMLAGRTLMKKLKNKEKFVLATKLLTDSSGKKMGKTEGNVVNLDDKPTDMYGKIMAFSDKLILPGFELLTDISSDEITIMEKELGKELNPRDAKARLAFEIVKMLNSEKEAQDASESFDKVFKDKQNPENMEEVKIENDSLSLIDLVIKSGLVKSNSDARRLIDQGAIKINGAKRTDAFEKIDITESLTMQIGKYRFVKFSK